MGSKARSRNGREQDLMTVSVIERCIISINAFIARRPSPFSTSELCDVEEQGGRSQARM